MSDDNRPAEQRPAEVEISERGGWLKDVDTTTNAVKPGGLPSAQVHQSTGGDNGSASGGGQQGTSKEGQ